MCITRIKIFSITSLLCVFFAGCAAGDRQRKNVQMDKQHFDAETLVQKPVKPYEVSFPNEIDLSAFTDIGDESSDPKGLVLAGIKLFNKEEYKASAQYFLAAANNHSDHMNFEILCLAASACATLRAGDRDGFLEIEKSVEDMFTAFQRLSPPSELIEMIALARFMRGEQLPTGIPISLKKLFDAVDDRNPGRTLSNATEMNADNRR